MAIMTGTIAPTEEPPLVREFSQLRHEIERLEEYAANLAGRLEFVLGPSPDRARSEKEQEPRATSSAVSTVNQYSRRLNDVVEALSILIDRLEV